MQIIVHVAAHFDWEPVPPGTDVSQKDIDARRVKPGVGGAWLMRVQRERATHTTIALPESEIVAQIIADAVRDKVTRTRHEAVALYLQRHVMPHHAHPKWMRDFECHDDGGDEALLRAELARHVAAGNIEPESIDEIVAAYVEPSDHPAHLRAHFKTTSKGVS